MADTVRIKTEDLEGRGLDWAVASASSEKAMVSDDLVWTFEEEPWPGADPGYVPLSPSRNWSQLGPLIERFKIDLEHFYGEWRAEIWDDGASAYKCLSEGETPLIAACRAIAAAHHGDYADVPRELVEET